MVEPAPARPRRFGTAPALAAWLLAAAGAALAAGPPPGLPRGRVTAVVDGDTVTVALADGPVRVRLIGIDAPELHESAKLDRDVARSGRARADIQAVGARARAALDDLAFGRTVALEADVESHDRYGRTLAWLWREDGTLLNEAMVGAGWARVYTVPPNVRHVERLRAAQQAARAAGLGLWADDGGTTPPGATPAPSTPRADADAAHGVAPRAGGCPPSHPVKGNHHLAHGRSDCVYHAPGTAAYAETRPERCYADVAEARAGGCRAPGR